MSPNLEADVGLIHIAGGGLRSTPPPGTLARSAPRRSGRGRAEDLLFLTLTLSDGKAPGGFRQHLAQAASEVFYRTPGSVTAATREAAAAINDRLIDLNRNRPDSSIRCSLLLGVLRGSDVYLAQAGAGQAVHLRGQQVQRFHVQQTDQRPLGLAPTVALRYHHFEAHIGDMLLLSAVEGELWSDPVLKAIGSFEPAAAIEQLSHSLKRDAVGMLLRFVPSGQAARPVQETTAAAAQNVGRAPKQARPPTAALEGALKNLTDRLQPVTAFARRGLVKAAAALTRLLVRLAPGVVEPPRPGEFSPALLAATAVAIPLIVVALVAVVYLGRGRSQQYQAYLLEAQTAIGTAQTAEDPQSAEENWRLAQYYLEQATSYGEDQNLTLLQQQVQSALDELDLVQRLEFTPVVSGGFGGDARLTHLAATASDLYVLDAANARLWHSWATGRGYEINRDFDCLDGPDSVTGMSTPVDIAVQQEPGALGAEGVVAIDADGTLLYCAPDRRSLTGQITPPSTGFGLIKAIDVFGDTLYILDPQANSVWIYDATGGLFSGDAGLYFAENVPDLSDAIDLAKSQDNLYILHSDGTLDRCLRTRQTDSGGSRFTVTCEQDLRFRDERDDGTETNVIPSAVISEMIYSPPPEPSLYFLDAAERVVHHYSMRMAYQGRIQPEVPFNTNVTALTLGPPNDLFVAAGNQVYHSQLP
ncbi:MAG: hypothetical protein ACLFWD_09590 [Anaerolineales bacterium]